MTMCASLDRDLKARLQRESFEQRQRVREIVLESNHPEKDRIVSEYDRNMWAIESGVASARSTWAALTEPQKRVMLALDEGRDLFRTRYSRALYDAVGKGFDAVGGICRLPTVKNLHARSLLDCAGGVEDPMRKMLLSDRGRFVLKRGRT
jgi:hypothetical protein